MRGVKTRRENLARDRGEILESDPLRGLGATVWRQVGILGHPGSVGSAQSAWILVLGRLCWERMPRRVVLLRFLRVNAAQTAGLCLARPEAVAGRPEPTLSAWRAWCRPWPGSGPAVVRLTLYSACNPQAAHFL